MGEMTVPLVDRGNGLWGSSSPAWDHLINRESSGRPTIIQQIQDVNSGGNEAEGLFQITPATWKRHNGTDFAPTARLATPQQQAIVAARIFTRNPTGSDWGAGRPGRESARDLRAGLVPVGGAPAPIQVPYGLPNGSNSGGYGGNGVKFPQWVYDLGNAFGLKPSTYPGHQESDRAEGGYAPNPQRLNRGIDWAAPGASDEVDRMQRFADYLFSVKDQLEQVIWWNPRTGKRIGVAGGKDVTNTPYYDYPGGYDDHRDHVHTRQSHSIPLPGGATPVAVPDLKPQFDERNFMTGGGRSNRTRPPINWLLHTEEGDSSAEQLARYCDGSHDVSYHYTVRDGIVCDVVDTDYASWSVLSANAFTINLCFAGSRAAWTRTQWLTHERDIEIAAYLAVQDCRKYNIPTTVIAPPYHQASGISDHKYVTQQLGIGTHVDVGNNFPWDVFTRYVNKYASPPVGDDDLSAEAEQILRDLRDALLTPIPSLSPMRLPGEGNVGTLARILRYMDSNIHVQLVIEDAKLGDPDTLNGLNQIINMDLNKYPDRAKDVTLAKNILAAARKSWGSPAVASDVAPQVAKVDTSELTAAYAEIARLREENGRLQAQPVTQAVAVADSGSTADRAGGVIKAVESWTDQALAMDTKQRAALTASIKVLEMKGDQ